MKTDREYKFYTQEKKDGSKKVIAVTHDDYGKVVKGIATCSPGDVFNLETGKELSKLRCEIKIAKKKFKSYSKFEKEWEIILSEEILQYKILIEQRISIESKYKNLEKELKTLTDKLK